jgi:nitric oxide reductase NorD protein
MGFDLDEIIFSKFTKYKMKSKKRKEEELSHLVVLDDIKGRLTILARAINAEAINIFPAEQEGGYRNSNFFLPISISLFSTYKLNYSFYIFRIIYLSIQKELEFNNENDINLEESRKIAFEKSHIILDKLFEDFPNLEEVYHLLNNELKLVYKENYEKNLFWLFGKFMQNEAETNPDINLNEFDEKFADIDKNKEDTIIKAKAIEEIKSITIDKKQQEDYVLLHNFEKVETAEEFDGNWRDFDGSDEIEDHQDALDELSMRLTVRVDDPTHSVYQTDFVENTSISESNEKEFEGNYYNYDEWNYKQNTYKKDFCRVYPKVLENTNPDFYYKTISQNAVTLNTIRKMLTNLNNRLQQVKNRNDGDEFDVDALTDLYVDVHSQKTPSENIYITKRKHEKDLSILLLLDISLSSESYVEGQLVLDIEKEVAIMFGEIMNEFNIDFAIDSFYSKTRNYSSYNHLKGFDDSWNTSKLRIGAIEASGYTRIGTALRHSGNLISKRESKDKWVILISDGKPNDYDKYEGKYGINDIKQAIKELNQKNINTYALAIEAQAKYYLPQMFGQNHFQILKDSSELVNALVRLYDKIKYK